MFSDLMGTIKLGIIRAAFTTTTNVEAYLAMRERAASQTHAEHQELGDLTASLPEESSKPQIPSSFTITVPGLAEPETETTLPSEGSLEALMNSLGMHPKSAPITPQPMEHEKIGRNAPCPCGSGKKYKNCCGR